MPTDIRCSRTLPSLENCWRTPPAHLPVDCEPRVSRSSKSTSTLRLLSWYARAHPMIPPPAMTTSALSMPEQAPELEDDLQSGQGRDVSVVERRRHLDHGPPDQLCARRGAAPEVERVPRREPPTGWDLGSGREGRVECVDVE